MALYHTAIFVVVIMVFCNAILYPSLFSTLFRQYFGSGSKLDKQKDDQASNIRSSSGQYPPHMRHGNPTGSSRPDPQTLKDARPPGPFPAERAAAAMAAQGQDGNKSSSRGMMGSILPVYAFGIVLYFAYIMYRIFFKDTGQRDPLTGRPIRGCWSQTQNIQNSADQLKQRMAEQELHKRLREELLLEKLKTSPQSQQDQQPATEAAATSSASVRKKGQTQQTQNDTSDTDMENLQARLEDTERTMHKMMEYMSKMGIAMDQVTEQMAKGGGGSQEGWDYKAAEDIIEGQDMGADDDPMNLDDSESDEQDSTSSGDDGSGEDSNDDPGVDDDRTENSRYSKGKAEGNPEETEKGSPATAKGSSDIGFQSGVEDCNETILLDDEARKGPVSDSQHRNAENFRRRKVAKDESEC